MPYFSDVGFLVGIDVGKAGFDVSQDPLPVVVDRPHHQAVFIVIAEYISVLQPAYFILYLLQTPMTSTSAQCSLLRLGSRGYYILRCRRCAYADAQVLDLFATKEYETCRLNLCPTRLGTYRKYHLSALFYKFQSLFRQVITLVGMVRLIGISTKNITSFNCRI